MRERERDLRFKALNLRERALTTSTTTTTTTHTHAQSDNKKCVVFLHGLRFNALTWDKTGILKGIAERYRAIAIDLPKKASGSSKVEFLSEVLSLIVKPRDKIVLVAASFGGSFATPYITRKNVDSRLVGYVSVAGILSHHEDTKQQQIKDIPLLMIYGEKDPLLQSDPIKYERMFHDSKLRVIKKEGHACYINPNSSKKFLFYLLEFLSKRARWTRLGASSYVRDSTTTLLEGDEYKQAVITPLHLVLFAVCLSFMFIGWRSYGYNMQTKPKQ